MPKISAPTLGEHRAETIDRLLDAFGDLVLAHGFADVSLSDVAAKAGLARTAIYNYYPDRDALLLAWTDREVSRTVGSLERQVAEADTFAEKLEIFVRAQLEEFALRHLPPGMEAVHLLSPEVQGRLRKHIEPVERILRTILAEGADAGEFIRGNPDALVPMVMACIGTERVPLATRTHTIKDASERVCAFLLRALAPPAAAGGARTSKRSRGGR